MDGGQDGLRFFLAAGVCLLAWNCGRHTARKVIVLGVDGMDPGFLERHWGDLPNLDRLGRAGRFSRLATTTPPQSPVAWSTFIIGLGPDETGIFDFIHRDPATMQPFLSTDRTLAPRWVLPLGTYRLPLSSSKVVGLRRGRAFWEGLRNRGIPVMIMRIPANYPPSNAGKELAGMGVPDLRGTEGTFTWFTDDDAAAEGDVAGGVIRRVTLEQGHAELSLEGPPNTIRAGEPPASIQLIVDVDPDRPYARIEAGDRKVILKQGEWSDWIDAEFPLLPHIASAPGMFRVYAKELHPGFRLYVSPVNVDPRRPALPLSSPESFSHEIADEIGEFGTLGIPEDTAAARQGLLDLDDFVAETKRIALMERKLLDYSLAHFEGGLLFYYFSTVDQASHMLWARHADKLLEFYQCVDGAVGEVLRREPDATVIVMSDHGFTAFDRAVNLNTWLLAQGWLSLDANGGIDWRLTRVYALGLNGLYLNRAGREKYGIVTETEAEPLEKEIRSRLLRLRDPDTGNPVVTGLAETRASSGNRSVAPDLIVGYAPGYRASWETALGKATGPVIEDNRDLWIGDHCIDAAYVPGVLIAPAKFATGRPSIGELARAIIQLFPVN